MVQPGDKVQILYPAYVAGKTAVVLEKETLQDGSKTGYWLVRTEGDGEVLALLAKEMRLLKST